MPSVSFKLGCKWSPPHLSTHSLTTAKFPSPIVLPTLYRSVIVAGIWKPSSDTSERVISMFLLVEKGTQMLHKGDVERYHLIDWKRFRINLSSSGRWGQRPPPPLLTLYTRQFLRRQMINRKETGSGGARPHPRQDGGAFGCDGDTEEEVAILVTDWDQRHFRRTPCAQTGHGQARAVRPSGARGPQTVPRPEECLLFARAAAAHPETEISVKSRRNWALTLAPPRCERAARGPNSHGQPASQMLS